MLEANSTELEISRNSFISKERFFEHKVSLNRKTVIFTLKQIGGAGSLVITIDSGIHIQHDSTLIVAPLTRKLDSTTNIEEYSDTFKLSVYGEILVLTYHRSELSVIEYRGGTWIILRVGPNKRSEIELFAFTILSYTYKVNYYVNNNKLSSTILSFHESNKNLSIYHNYRGNIKDLMFSYSDDQPPGIYYAIKFTPIGCSDYLNGYIP